MSNWISVDKKLPDNNRKVLVYNSFKDMYLCRLPVILSKNNEPDSSNIMRERITFWCNVPESFWILCMYRLPKPNQTVLCLIDNEVYTARLPVVVDKSAVAWRTLPDPPQWNIV